MITVDDRGASVAVVAFSGLSSRNLIFEWTAAFQEIPANFIGVQDPNRDWYQTAGPDITADILNALDRLRPARLVCVGGSAGGFAALVFGRDLRADRIIVFNPQSACGAAKRALGDDRWPKFCLRTSTHDIAGAYPDAVVHYAADDVLDCIHAARIVSGDAVRWPHGGHNMPKALKEQGLLEPLLRAAVV